MKKQGCVLTGGMLYFVFWIYIGIAWIINLIQGIKLLLDYDPNNLGEVIIKAIGVFIAPAAGITVWF